MVLAVGTELGESDLWGPAPALRGTLSAWTSIPRSSRRTSRRTSASRPTRAPPSPRCWTPSPRAPRRPPGPAVEEVRAAIHAEALEDGAPWLPLVNALAGALGPVGVLSGDSTMPAYYGVAHFLAMDAAARFIYPTGYATLGYALPAAIGAKLADPDRPVIALVGDGGLLFTVVRAGDGDRAGAAPTRRRAQQRRLRRDPRPDGGGGH